MLVDPLEIEAFLRTVHLFGKLTDEQMSQVVAAVGARRYLPGAVIYETSAESTDFFLLYTGKVQITRAVEGEDEYAALLEPGDAFGFEAMDTGALRQTSAVSQDDTLVFVFDWETLRILQQDISPLRMRLDLMTRGFNLLFHLPLSWREPGEVVYYAARRHGFFLLLRLIAPVTLVLLALPLLYLQTRLLSGMVTPLLVAGFLLAVATVWFLWNYIDWTNDYNIITDRRVIYLERILWLYDSRLESPLDAILNVNQRTTQVGRILGYGDVIVRTYTGSIELNNLAQPQEVQVMIERLLLRARSRQAEEQQRKIGQVIRHRLSPPPSAHVQAAPSAQEPVEAHLQPGGLQVFLANFFRTRFEQDGIVTYRKHWFVLLQQIWAPSLILIALLILLILRLTGAIAFITLGSFLALILAVGFVIFLWWLYQYLDWTNDRFIVTFDTIIDLDKKPLGTETRKTAPIKNILAINYERLGIIGNLLNYGTVFIKVGETTFTFDNVYNPSSVQRELFLRLSEFKRREKQAEAESEERRMADWIEHYDRWRRQQEPPVQPSG